MLKYSYHKEIYKQLVQFSAAFDDSFVYRFTKGGDAKEKIGVRYIFGPKHRVMNDIVNQAKNMTLPAIAIEQTNIRRDSSRIQFKDQRITRPNKGNSNISRVPTPIPVVMELNVSIIANYKEDIDQIVCNIIPFCNPYFIISWKVPEEFGMDYNDEIRSEVTWAGDVSFENPVNLGNTDKYIITGTTSFTLKGWIFPPLETTQAPIYVVNNNFVSVPSDADLYSYSYSLSDFADTTDTILVSAYPEFTNGFYKGMPIYSNINLSNTVDHVFTFYGKRYGYNNIWYLSGSNPGNFPFSEIDTAKFPTISAYQIPQDLVTTVNDNIVSISLSSTDIALGSYTFVTANSAGWVAWDHNVIINN